MSSTDFIIKNPQWTTASQDYERLRKEGIQHIEKLGHALWTDYNIHDPGITLLELLCYAITDLGYRTSHDISDILTKEVAGEADILGNFHTAKDIFSCDPVSFTDLRKLLVDIKGVKNAWVEKHKGITLCTAAAHLTDCPKTAGAGGSFINGLYDVYVDFEESVENDEGRDEVLARVKDCVLDHRNLCEDIINICNLEKEQIALCADLEVTPGADVESVLAEIFFQLDQFISPDIRFYSIEELLSKGKTTDEIFAGPTLDHGFIDDDEFRQIERRCALRVSDIIRLILDKNPEVVSVKDISLLSFINGVKRDQQKWILELADDTFRSPRFSDDFSRITFYKNGLPYYANPGIVDSLLKEKRGAVLQSRLKGHADDLHPVVGEDQMLAEYYPVQNEMPATYLVGKTRVPDSAPLKRKAQSRQFKAWIMFFEQLLANYLSQLAHIHDLFSWQEGSGKTYFTQMVTGIADQEDLFVQYSGLETALNEIIESDSAAERRKNTFLDHLLARFSESFTEYGLLMYNLRGEPSRKQLISEKRDFLENYPQLSKSRGQGFDYRFPEVKENISGYQRRVYSLLGIHPRHRRNFSYHGFSIESVNVGGREQFLFVLRDEEGTVIFESIPCDDRDSIEALLDLTLTLGYVEENFQLSNDSNSFELVLHCDDIAVPQRLGNTVDRDALAATQKYFQHYGNPEGFHVIEHVLLRRRGGEDPYMPIQLDELETCNCVEVTDPYSFRFSVYLPAWPERFRDLRFRKFIEDTLRLEAPAHTQLKICWLSHTQMQKLEGSYNSWAALLAGQVENLGGCRSKGLTDLSGQLPLPEESPANYAQALDDLIKTLHSLTTVYPMARLHDCEHSDTDVPPITLNNTILGTF